MFPELNWLKIYLKSSSNLKVATLTVINYALKAVYYYSFIYFEASVYKLLQCKIPNRIKCNPTFFPDSIPCVNALSSTLIPYFILYLVNCYSESNITLWHLLPSRLCLLHRHILIVYTLKRNNVCISEIRCGKNYLFRTRNWSVIYDNFQITIYRYQGWLCSVYVPEFRYLFNIQYRNSNLFVS